MNANIELIRFAGEAHACAAQMDSNARYIGKELPAIEMPAELRTKIETLCHELVSSALGVTVATIELEELLVADADMGRITSKMETMRGRITGETIAINGCVQAVEEAVKAGTVGFILSMLIMESAVNIFNATPTWPATDEVAEEQEETEDEDHDEG